jgi:hypothetical protein
LSIVLQKGRCRRLQTATSRRETDLFARGLEREPSVDRRIRGNAGFGRHLPGELGRTDRRARQQDGQDSCNWFAHIGLA